MPAEGAQGTDMGELAEAATGPGLYVHVPFCVSKCRHCDFYSLPVPQPPIEEFL